MKKVIFKLYYQIVINREVSSHFMNTVYYFTSLRCAKDTYRELLLEKNEKSSNIVSVDFVYILHYFDNRGKLLLGCGSTLKEAREKINEILNK